MSYTSTRYKNVSRNLNEIVDELLKNKNLLKWLTYLVDDPLSLPDIPKSKVLGNQIVLTRVNPDILPEAVTKLFIIPKGGLDHRQGFLSDTVFEVNILSPFRTGYIYPYRIDRYTQIASEIALSLDGKHITGVGDVTVSTDFTSYKVDETYAGLRLYITVTNQRVKR